MSTGRVKQMETELIKWAETRVGDMVESAFQAGDPVAYSAVYNQATGKRVGLAIATIDPRHIELIEKILELPTR